MKTIHLLTVLAVASLLIMIAIDYVLGAKAEFLNAWSVIERLLGRTPAAGDSTVYQRFGAAGELACVLLVNLAIGGVLTILLRPWVGN